MDAEMITFSADDGFALDGLVYTPSSSPSERAVLVVCDHRRELGGFGRERTEYRGERAALPRTDPDAQRKPGAGGDLSCRGSGSGGRGTRPAAPYRRCRPLLQRCRGGFCHGSDGVVPADQLNLETQPRVVFEVWTPIRIVDITKHKPPQWLS
jgi:hypothetical protein